MGFSTGAVLQPATTGPGPGGETRSEAGGGADTTPSLATSSAEVYAMPATQGQLRFWSLDQLNPGNPALNMPLMWRCTGPLNLDAMVQAFTLCVARHEVLRTTFELIDGLLSQVIHPAASVAIPLVDVSHLQGEAQRLEADLITRDHAAYRFDLKNGPLLALKMLRFDEQRHLLLVSMHHVICDGISNGILLRDMAVFYEALLKGGEAALPELPVQFADFAVWQEEWLKSDGPAASLEFWRKSLGADFSRLNLTRDEDAVEALAQRREDWTGDIETLLIPAELQARAHAFCKRENVTLNILLFSVFSALMNRLTGQQDLTIGSPCANRTEDTDELIGLFMNIQVMRLRLAEGGSFRALLRHVEEWTLGAYENQSLPFENLVHDPYFSNGRNAFEIPIFFLYQKSFMITHHIDDLEIVPLRSESPGAVFEMMFAIVDRAEEGPRLQLEYNPHFFKVGTIQRYLRMFNQLLESALNAPDARVDELGATDAEERRQLVSGWNDTAIEFGTFVPVHQALLARAAREPGRLALECGETQWTYQQLTDYALRLAKRMTDEGLQPGELVGICVERSAVMLGAVLAVMLAGGAYVPLDPRHPQKRLELVLEDAGAKLLLVKSDPGVETTAKLIDLTAPMPASNDFVPAVLTAQSLAYVIYTSGSTGRPKGVAIEHGALMNLLRSMEREPGLTEQDTLVAITTLAFDIAGLELLLPLMTGAKLVIATDGEVQDGRRLLELTERSRATVLQATPGAWRILIDAGWNGPHPVKALCGGEALPRELAEKLLDRANEVWNMYGPTETTIWSSATRVVRGKGSVRIGKPIANTQFYVLSERKQLASVGVTGELYIGGAGLARGYWGKPDLTAEKFCTNPFGQGRIYASGDLARRRDDGTIELLGRTDFQVKIRGYRIELAEIEAAIMEHAGVRETVVTALVTEATGVTRLIAYVATGREATESHDTLISEVKARLARTLPPYLLPNSFVALRALPRNENGKIDRRALPGGDAHDHVSWSHSIAAKTEDYYPPRDVIERQLVNIWQTTLGIPEISIRASFFSLGVGSLAALRLITKMNRVYAMDLGLASLISAATIESIAELIRTRCAPNTDSSVVPLQAHGAKPPLFILHGVGGNVVSFYGLATRMGKDQPVYGIQAQSLLSKRSALLQLKDMATSYIADMRKVQPHGPYHLLGYSFGGTLALEMAHQLRSAGEEVATIGMLDARTKGYDEAMALRAPAQARLNNRMDRFRGNTERLKRDAQVKYILGKFWTRTIRYTSMMAATLGVKRIPAFMRSATDINTVAIKNYTPHPYDGRMVLFRATEQDHVGGPYELGWSELFLRGIEVHDLPGDHERLFLEPNIDQLAESLREALGAAAR